MKKLKYGLAGILILALCVCAWFYAYYNRKSNDNLPSPASIAAMDEAAANEVLCGYQRIQLHEVWGDPDESDSNEDIWEVQGGGTLVVNYNNKDVVVICSIPQVTEIDHSRIQELAEEKFAKLFEKSPNVEIHKTTVSARTDNMNRVIVRFEYSSDAGSGVYGFEYLDGEDGNAKLVRHGEDVGF